MDPNNFHCNCDEQSKSAIVCSVCPIDKCTATAFCTECKKLFCRGHGNDHKYNIHQKLIDIGILNESYCEDCQRPVCICCISRHNSHSVKEIPHVSGEMDMTLFDGLDRDLQECSRNIAEDIKKEDEKITKKLKEWEALQASKEMKEREEQHVSTMRNNLMSCVQHVQGRRGTAISDREAFFESLAISKMGADAATFLQGRPAKHGLNGVGAVHKKKKRTSEACALIGGSGFISSSSSSSPRPTRSTSGSAAIASINALLLDLEDPDRFERIMDIAVEHSGEPQLIGSCVAALAAMDLKSCNKRLCDIVNNALQNYQDSQSWHTMHCAIGNTCANCDDYAIQFDNMCVWRSFYCQLKYFNNCFDTGDKQRCCSAVCYAIFNIEARLSPSRTTRDSNLLRQLLKMWKHLEKNGIEKYEKMEEAIVFLGGQEELRSLRMSAIESRSSSEHAFDVDDDENDDDDDV